ncbi:MAG: PAS domain S-box protein [Ignavibacteriales bacterium]|nr:PAS domain S-box protein [Ignavibacteriales bacterium]
MKNKYFSYIVKVVALFAIYFITATVGLKMDAVSGFATLVWPPTGISLAAILIFGYSLWPGVFVGAFLVNYFTGAPLLVALGMGTGNTLEALFGAYLLHRFAGFQNSLERLRDVLALIIFAAVSSTIVSATIGVSSLWLGGVISLPAYISTWKAWWIGDALGDIVVASLLLTWENNMRIDFELKRVMEKAIFFTMLIIVSYVVFSDIFNYGSEKYLRPYMLFPVLIWGALSIGQRWTVTATFFVSVIALVNTAHGHGPFIQDTVSASLLSLQIYMGVIAVTSMILAAVTAEHKRTEELLYHSNELFTKVFHSSPLAIALTRVSDRRYVEVNDAFLSMVGFERDEVIGRTSLELGMIIDTAERERFIQHLQNKGADQAYEMRIRKRNNEIITVLVSAEVVHINGELSALAIIEDISERKQAEESLRRSELRFRSVFEETPIGIALIGLDLKLMDVNPAFCTMLGYMHDELMTKTVEEISHPDDYKKDLALATRVLQREFSSYELEKRYFTKNGEIVWGRLNASIVCDADGKPLHGIGMVENITEQKRSTIEREAISEIIRSVNVTANLDELLLSIHQSIKKVVYAENFFIVLHDKTTDMFYKVYYVDLVDPPFPPYKIGRSCTAYVFRIGKSLLLTQEHFDQLVEQGEVELVGANSPSWLGVPLKTTTETIGVLVVQHYEKENAYSHRDIGFLESVAEEIAIAIERKRTEEELSRQRLFLRQVIDLIPNFVFAKDKEGRITLANQAVADLRGITVQNLLGKKELEFNIHKEEIEQFDRSDEEVFTNREEVFVREESVTDSHGKVHWVQTTKRPIFSSDGKVEQVLGVATDITERKISEEKLAESEMRFRTLFDEMMDGVYRSTHAGRFVEVNPSMVRMFGYESREEMLNVDIRKELYFAEEDRESHFLDTGTEKVEIFRMRRKDGSEIWVEDHGRYVHDEQGNVIFHEGVLRDVTERKKLEEQLRQSQKMESIGVLAGGIAHDFNNLLGIIGGYASLLERRRNDPEKFSQNIEAINTAVTRGAGLVKQMLTFARKANIQLESVNVTALLEELVKMGQQTFPKTITFSIHSEPNIPSIIGDTNQLHQALLNICVNARDAMPGGGELSLRSRLVARNALNEKFPDATQEQYVCISIGDTGTGIDEQTKLRMFEPFFTTKEKGKGTGLGLSTVYGIVKSHNGFMEVESEVGKGTTFYFYFPARSFVMEMSNTKTDGGEIRSGTETILIIEDEEMLGEVLKNVLEDNGYSILWAKDGLEAVEMYRIHQQKISAVVTDMGLPKLDGAAAFIKMHFINPKIKVILASGYLEPEIKSELFKAGAKEFIQKPYKHDEILRKVRDVIDAEV